MSTTPERRRIGRKARDAPTSGWLDVVWRVKDDDTADNVSMIAAGAAFFDPPRALLLEHAGLTLAERKQQHSGTRPPCEIIVGYFPLSWRRSCFSVIAPRHKTRTTTNAEKANAASET
jgi:hypothetical protein